MFHSTLATFTVLALATPAAADPSGAQAEVLYNTGLALMKEHNYAEACARFEASEKLEPATTTVVSLADCRERNEQYASAWGLYLRAERELRGLTDANGLKLHQLARDRADKLVPRLSHLTIRVVGAQPANLEIIRDNDHVDAGMWNTALPIDGGTLRISARAPGHREWATTVVVQAEHDDQVVEVPTLVVEPIAAPRPEQLPTPRVSSRPQRPPPPVAHPSHTWLYVGGAAVVLGAGALGFELWGRSIFDDAKTASTQSDAERLTSSANLRRDLAMGFGAAAAVGAGVAVYSYVRQQREPRIAPTISPTSAAVVLSGAF